MTDSNGLGIEYLLKRGLPVEMTNISSEGACRWSLDMLEIMQMSFLITPDCFKKNKGHNPENEKGWSRVGLPLMGSLPDHR